VDDCQAAFAVVVWDRNDVQLDAPVIGTEEVHLRPFLGLDHRRRRRVGHRRQNVGVSDPVAPP